MTFDAKVLKVLIASPGDTSEERDAVERSLHGWNASRAEREQTMLFPWRWEKYSVPKLGGSAQSILNTQAVDSSDIVVAIFDSRLGQVTEEAVSGTAEEITRAHEAGKPVHVYFSNEPISRDRFDAAQYEALQRFRKQLESQGLLGEYADPTDLGHQVRNAIEHDLGELGLEPVGRIKRGGDQAIPVFRHESWREQTGMDKKGTPRYTTKHRLILENKSTTVTAESVTIDFGELRGNVIERDPKPFDLLPLTDVRWPIALHMGSPDRPEITITWQEDGEAHSLTQPVSMY